MHLIAEALGWIWLFALACFALAIIAASLCKREWRACSRCETMFITIDADDWLCPACHRADAISAQNRDWPECDPFSETAMHNNSQGGTSTQNSRQPSPKSFGRKN